QPGRLAAQVYNRPIDKHPGPRAPLNPLEIPFCVDQLVVRIRRRANALPDRKRCVSPKPNVDASMSVANTKSKLDTNMADPRRQSDGPVWPYLKIRQVRMLGNEVVVEAAPKTLSQLSASWGVVIVASLLGFGSDYLPLRPDPDLGGFFGQ